MGEVLGSLLPTALGVALSPVPVIAVILMLMARQAKVASLAFTTGWVAAIAVVSTVLALVVPGTGGSDEPATWASWVKLALGLLLLTMAVRQWRGRPSPGETPKLPAWMSAIDEMTPGRALGLGVLLAAVNPKNLALLVGAGVAIGNADLTAGEITVCLIVFVVFASASVAGPVLAYLVAQERMRAPLSRLREWLTDNNATVMAVLLLFLGVTMGGQGLGGLI